MPTIMAMFRLMPCESESRRSILMRNLDKIVVIPTSRAASGTSIYPV